MSGFGRAAHAEILKILTTRMWWVIAIVLVLYVGSTAGGVAASLAFAERTAGADGPGLAAAGIDLTAMVYGTAVSIGYVFPVLFGALAVTGELRHQTITPTFLATPRRSVSLAAKSLVQLGMGATYGVLAFVASVGAGAAAFAAFRQPTALGDADTWLLVARGVLAMGLWAVVGVGVGALLRNQVAAIVVVIAFTQFVEPLLRVAAALVPALRGVGQFLPGAAGDALVGSSIFSALGTGTSSSLTWWAGGLVLLGYAVVAGLVGYRVTWRRDVT